LSVRSLRLFACHGNTDMENIYSGCQRYAAVGASYDRMRSLALLFTFNNGYRLAVSLSGNALVSINVVTLRWARLVPGRVTVFGWVNYLGM